MTRLLSIAAVLVLSASGSAMAQPPHPWVAVSAGLNTYAMTDVNEDIQSLNALLAPASMDEIRSAFGFGASAGVDLRPFTASLAYERLPASADLRSPSVDYEYDLAANAVVARIALRTPRVGRFQPSFGVGGGIAFVSGEFGRIVEEMPTSSFGTPDRGIQGVGQAEILGPRVEVSGHGPYVEGYAQAETRLGPRLAIAPAIGYRYARIEARQRGSEGEADGTFDFSGLAARVAVKVALD